MTRFVEPHNAPLTHSSNPALGGTLIFWWLILMAMGTFSLCVLLPDWRDLQLLREEEHHRAVEADRWQAAVDRERRLVEALCTDPAVMHRVAQRELGFRQSNRRSIAVFHSDGDEWEFESARYPDDLMLHDWPGLDAGLGADEQEPNQILSPRFEDQPTSTDSAPIGARVFSVIPRFLSGIHPAWAGVFIAPATRSALVFLSVAVFAAAWWLFEVPPRDRPTTER